MSKLQTMKTNASILGIYTIDLSDAMSQPPKEVPNLPGLTHKSSKSTSDADNTSIETKTPIIALSKLKNYMPKSPNSKLNSLVKKQKERSEQFDAAFDKTIVSQRDKQTINLQREPARNKQTHDRLVARHTNNSRGVQHESLDIEKSNCFESGQIDHRQAKFSLNQVYGSADNPAQQESKCLVQQSSGGSGIAPVSAVDSNRSLCIAPSNKGAKEAELSGGPVANSATQGQQLDHAAFLSDREERKRKRTDNLPSPRSSQCNSGHSSATGKSRAQSSEIDRQKGFSCGYVRNNMTPSALLHTQSAECSERLRLDRTNRALYQELRSSATQRDNNYRRQLMQNNSLTRLPKACSQDTADTLNPAEANQHIHNPLNREGIDGIEIGGSHKLAQSSAPTVTPVRQQNAQIADELAIASSHRGNSIAQNSADNLHLKTNISLSHPVIEGNLYQSQTVEKDIEQSNISLHNISNNSHHGANKFNIISRLNRSTQPDRTNPNAPEILSNQYQQTHFTTPMLAGQQFKFDNSYVGRLNNGIDSSGNFSGSFERHSEQLDTSGTHTQTLNRDVLAHHQGHRGSVSNQYNSHHQYNLITSTSKSSSPNSTNSSPSPRVYDMQAINPIHGSNHIIPSGLNHSSTSTMTTSESHLDNLNNHYMSGGAANLGLNQQHHQLNHHYSFNPQATAHHLSIPTHDQSYSHAQQQQHQHQQQQEAQMHQQAQGSNLASQQHSIYHQIANSGSGAHAYGVNANAVHYHSQFHSSNNQANSLVVDAQQNHLNTAAAAAHAAAVVSQKLKTVTNQHNNHQQNYGSSVANGFAAGAGLMNMAAHNHQQFHNTLSQHQLNHHHQRSVIHPNQHSLQHQQVVHQAASVVARKYQCKMCPQVFMSKAEMKYHNQNHMREAKPYKCLQCPKAFANSSYLSQHMRIHQGLKPYTCDICLRKFTQLSHLQQHKRTHTGDKPYKCNYMNCTKQFSQLSNLQSHSRCHQLDKPYKCNSCYKCFHDEASLLEHIPRHLESKHLKKNLCIFCGSSYQQERGLAKHFQQYHTDKTPTLVAAAIAAGTTGNTNLIASLISSSQSGVFVTSSGGGGAASNLSGTSSGVGNGMSCNQTMNGHNDSNTDSTGASNSASLNPGQGFSSKCSGM